MRWYIYAGVAVVLFAGGFLAGRRSVPGGGTATHVDTPTTPDGGVPEARAATEVGPGKAVTVLTCKVEPPVVRWLPRSCPGTAPVECPQMECPAVVCSGTASVETPQVTAQTAVPLLPPTVVTVHETERRRIWGIGLSGLYGAGVVRPGPALVVSPFPWLDLHAAGSTNAGEVDIVIRP